MAAMVASHVGNMWPRREEDMMPSTPLPMSNMMSTTHYSPAQAVPAYHQYTQNVLPTYSTAPPPMAPQMSFHSGAYGFGMNEASSYGTQHNYIMHTQQIPQSLATAPPTPTLHNPTYQQRMPHLNTQLRRSPSVKAEETSPTEPAESSTQPLDYSLDSAGEGAVMFSTDVDCLMRAIQAQEPVKKSARPAKVEIEQAPLPTVHAPHVSSALPSFSRSRKRYSCSMPDCTKTFYQKTHLEIHVRTHTGIKPFVCKEPGCGQHFSQMGNLKTHERRHTGERPYTCEICGKTFAQRGNVRAHKIVHQQIKPFTCKLDDCGKQFTQLGNLKSHQNKFHASTLRNLTNKFAQSQQGIPMSPADKELWDYFASLYKNSNKGIKGRGKDRKVSAPSQLPSPVDYEPSVAHSPSVASSTSPSMVSAVTASTSVSPSIVAPVSVREQQPVIHPSMPVGAQYAYASQTHSRTPSYSTNERYQGPAATMHMIPPPMSAPMMPVHPSPNIMPPRQQEQAYIQYEDQSGYGNMVFPERRHY